MLKDIIQKNIHIISKKRNQEIYPYKYKGILEIFGYRNGELFHYDKAHNVATVWSKHSSMHLLTGEVFSDKGVTRSDGTHISGDTNTDGTLVSAKQYFDGDSITWWCGDSTGDPNMDYPFFPTKMLFGTGFEFASWASMTGAQQTYYTTLGWAQATFDANISDAKNDYSNYYYGDTLYKRKSINDMNSNILVTPTITDQDFGIAGAIKHGTYESRTGDSAKLDTSSGSEYLLKQYQGIGHPCMIYAKRTGRFYQSGSEVALSFDDHQENKITFTVTLPEQTGSDAGRFYPYNGHILKVAGLFTDARFVLENTTPGNDAASDDSPQYEFDNYSKMPYGMLFAKRYIAPITKDHDVSITARWTIYL